MSRIISLLRTHTLSVGLIAALVPLVPMLAMQYVWLSRLADASAVAEAAARRNLLDAVGTEVEYFYRASAEGLLSVPAAVFEQGAVRRIASLWQQKPRDGVGRLFAVDFTATPTGNFYLYDDETRSLRSSPATEESLAIVLAALPYQTRAASGEPLGAVGIQVDERDPAQRIVLNPILDEGGKLVGIVGMLLDAAYVRDVLLPGIVTKTLPAYLGDADAKSAHIVVRDAVGRVVFGRPTSALDRDAPSVHLPFVFRDWTVSLEGSIRPQAAALGTGFLFDMTIGLLLAIALVAGIALALRAANRTMRLSQLQSDFVSNVSHELRTPLASIRLFADLMRLGKVRSPEAVIDYGERIENESLRLTRLIDNILDFAQIEANAKRYSFAPTDVVALVRTVSERFAARLERDGYRLLVELPEAAELEAALDAEAVGQALGNLIDNAAKYSEAPSDIVVRLEADERELRLGVQDHGVGVPKADRRRIFERFQRVSSGLVHDVRGSGLGLSIVAHIVRAHGGEVTLASTPGDGSTFTLRLPREARARKEGGPT